MNRRRVIWVALCTLFITHVRAQVWYTHLAYNNVTQIAMADNEVFAISDGSLFSVNKVSEQIKVYNNQSGLHSTGVHCIHYDKIGKQLIIGYGTGKIDILSASGVRYIGELYDKDMTQRKTINNVTISGRTAYLSTAYGIQTMDLRENKLVDSYWLRPGGEETDVIDILVTSDSIYAFTSDSLFSAGRNEELVDYTVWRREIAGRISRDSEKGTHYQDGADNWYAGQTEGIIRYTATEKLCYKPNGPINNNPYYLAAAGDEVFMLNGGRWTAQNMAPGHVMHYSNKQWYTITAAEIEQRTLNPAWDMMNIAVDPMDNQHYFITSYGTGLYEFRNDSFIGQTLADGVIGSAVPTMPNYYTRLSGGVFDSENRLWFLNAGGVNYPLIYKDSSGFHGIPILIDGVSKSIEIPGDILIDQRNEHYKWILSCYKSAAIIRIDDNGTPDETSDDRSISRSTWTDQNGQEFKPLHIYHIMQDKHHRIWLCTEQGVAYIDGNTDFSSSDAIIRPAIMDNNGENPLTSMPIKAICQSTDGHLWIGTQNIGVYELNEDATSLLTHYTTDNSAMSSNGILSLCASADGHVWIGTAEGLAEYNPNGHGAGIEQTKDEAAEESEGQMLQWRLHLSYSNPQAIAATPNRIFAMANGSLFSVDRADEQIHYWSKATGLSGTTITHIAYDKETGRLIVGYSNGQIDLIEDNGNVIPMPDISMKAGSMDISINSIAIGQESAYLAMPFGIIAISPKRAEISDTYYIGENGAAIAIQQVAQIGDSIYAFSYDKLYYASTNDNLVDFQYWKSQSIPFEMIDQGTVFADHIYALYHDSLYMRDGAEWKMITDSIQWIHTSGTQLLCYREGTGLLSMDESGKWTGINNSYVATDAIYSNGEYWIAQKGQGLIRLGSAGDELFFAEGPLNNFGYHLDTAHDRIYVAPGGRWAGEFARWSGLSIYDGQVWKGLDLQDITSRCNHDIRDVVQYAIDPQDPGHFYVATYGTGLWEFRDYLAYKRYDSSNSTLRKAVDNIDAYYYTRTDGPMMDEQGNLWVMNATSIGQPLHVLTPDGVWHPIPLRSGGENIVIETPSGTWIDRRNSNYKWMMSQRANPALICLNDNGTPTYSGDDRCMARSSFVDQNGTVLSPSQFRCFAQDHTNRIWIGTDKGILVIPKEVDFFSSNSCKRIIIPRNDGTNLADYLLGDEQINCLAVDGGNRMWIGTANSGLYLIEDDTITVAHFTENNSLLPSNSIQSIAIMGKTGEVFVGTDNGIASYRSDASDAQEQMSNAYAYPNPVRPNYSGAISICGLMENTTVNIIDAGGGLVCKTKSHGGTAVWDGRLADGRRATPGVYTALCNSASSHTVVKILVIR